MFAHNADFPIAKVQDKDDADKKAKEEKAAAAKKARAFFTTICRRHHDQELVLERKTTCAMLPNLPPTPHDMTGGVGGLGTKTVHHPLLSPAAMPK